MKQPNISQFQAWAEQHAELGHAVVAAQAFAQCERERVDAYIQPLFELFDFYPSADMIEHGRKLERITDKEQLYMTDLAAPEYLRFCEECDIEHRKHGFTGPKGHCLALVAEELQRKAEIAMLNAAGDLFGVDFSGTWGDTRKHTLDLLLGATIKAWSEKHKAA